MIVRGRRHTSSNEVCDLGRENISSIVDELTTLAVSGQDEQSVRALSVSLLLITSRVSSARDSSHLPFPKNEESTRNHTRGETYQGRQVRHERTPSRVTTLLEPIHTRAVVDTLRSQAVGSDKRGQVVQKLGAHIGRLANVALLARPAGVDDRDIAAGRSVNELVGVGGCVVPLGQAGAALRQGGVAGGGGGLDEGKPAHERDDGGEKLHGEKERKTTRRGGRNFKI